MNIKTLTLLSKTKYFFSYLFVQNIVSNMFRPVLPFVDIDPCLNIFHMQLININVELILMNLLWR